MGQRPPPPAKILPKIEEKREQVGKKGEKSGETRQIGKKRTKSGRFFHFAPPDIIGLATLLKVG